VSPDLDVGSGCILDRGQLAAARLARRNLGAALVADPAVPVRPPGALLLACARKPLLGRLGALVIDPVAILLCCRWIDDTSYEARCRQTEALWPGNQLGQGIGRSPGRNVILAAGEHIDRGLDLAKIDRDAQQLDTAW